MPTVLRKGPWVVRVHAPPREHPPPHVHVILGGGEVIVRLGRGSTPPVVLAVYRMRDQDVVRAYRLVERYRNRLLATWERLHGESVTE